MIEAVCGTCRRDVYVADDEDLFCPVCSTPLARVEPAESEAG